MLIGLAIDLAYKVTAIEKTTFFSVKLMKSFRLGLFHHFYARHSLHVSQLVSHCHFINE